MFFFFSGLSTSYVSRLNVPEIKPLVFKHVLVTKEQASIETSLSHYNSLHSNATNSAISVRIWPKLELVQDFMLVFVTCKLKKIRSIATEKTWRHQFFRCSRAANSIVSGPIWPKFELMQDITHVYETSNFKKDWINTNREKVETLMF